jgi:hypothetical protein
MSRTPPANDGACGGSGGSSGRHSSSHPASSSALSRKDHQLQQRLLAEAMASLQLHQPHEKPPPSIPPSAVDASLPSDSRETTSPPPHSHDHPTITILVVADIDLASASELSEYALRHRLHIDLCIACGSFCRDEDLTKMAAMSNPSSSTSKGHFGRSNDGDDDDEPRRGEFVGGRGGGSGGGDTTPVPISRAMAGGGGRGGVLRSIMALSGPNKSQSPNCWYPRRTATDAAAAEGSGVVAAGDAAATTGGSSSGRSGWDATPLFRTREQTSALEGLMTATLSQLENIVCRVVYCPGSTDPITSILGQAAAAVAATDEVGAAVRSPSAPPRRYTPNSRNVHRQWLPLAPGLGTAALLYLDCSDQLVRDATAALVRWSSAPGGGSRSNRRGDRQQDDIDDDDEDEDDDDDDDEDNEANENIALWIDQLKQLKQQYVSCTRSASPFGPAHSFFVILRRVSGARGTGPSSRAC